MGGGLTLGLAPKHKLKKRQHKKEIYSWPACYTYAGRDTSNTTYFVILLTFAVTFLLQVDFFLVGTSRA